MTAEARREARSRAADDVVFKFKCQHEKLVKTTQLPYAAEDGMFCLKGFKEAALKHIKQALSLGASTAIKMEAVWQHEAFDISSSTALEGFMLSLRRAQVRQLEAANYIVHVDVMKKGREKKGADEPERPTVTAFKEIALHCYKEKLGGATGTWNIDCSNVVAELPSVLKGFVAQRTLVERAMGDGRWLINPITAACPFAGCKDLRHRSSAVNYYQCLFADRVRSHWRKQHANNPAVDVLIKRFELLLKNPNISDDQLDRVAGANPLSTEWMAAHNVDKDDGLRPFDELPDLFDPQNVSSNMGRAMWVEATKAQYKEQLRLRAEGRSRSTEREAQEQRERTAQAMGVPVEELAEVAEQVD